MGRRSLQCRAERPCALGFQHRCLQGLCACLTDRLSCILVAATMIILVSGGDQDNAIMCKLLQSIPTIVMTVMT